jgi:hypothetical protein
MCTNTKKVSLFLLAVLLSIPSSAGVKKKLPVIVESTGREPAVLWREPTDIEARDLFYGPGGKRHEPHGTFTFVKEDLGQSNPKFIVVDQDGMKWKVKLGAEARPETVATRLMWAVGYFANEDYFLPLLRPENMPARLARGQQFVNRDGSVRNVRLKREPRDEKKIGNWAWREDPFTGTRELNGLRVMMALINNWDLKDENNAVYEEAGRDGQGPRRIYMVSDVGASFGTVGPWWPRRVAEGNPRSYAHSKFIRTINPEQVDFRVPGRPPWVYSLINRTEYRNRRDMVWIGRNIPRADARWIGQILARLSPNQLRDAFRAAGYTPEQVEKFASVIEHRITELNQI